MNENLHILILEDVAADIELIQFELGRGGILARSTFVQTREEFVYELQNDTPDLILSDYGLPSFDGITALRIAHEKCPEVPFIFVTGTLGEDVTIETLKGGATDYVLKNRLSRLVPAVQRALREAEERAERKRTEERLRRSHEQLRALSAHLRYVREEERTRLARAVHDELGQALTSLKIDVSWLAGHIPREFKQLHKKTRSMLAYIDATIQTVRRISTELRPGILDTLGLVAALEWQAREFQKRTGIQCTINTTVQRLLLNQDLNTAFFRIFQETLTNVIRHAQATRVDVQLHEENGHLRLEVKDNGRGISEAEILNIRSIGLLGMRERTALLGGTFHIQGAAGKGSTVTVAIPLPPSSEREEQMHHEDSDRRRPLRGSPGG